jgi:hypothetical protein
MSYLGSPRIVFSGRYQADVSTVNNDVRHYDIPDWESRFQNPTQGKDLNGWWNPEGTGAFRVVGAKVTAAESGAAGHAADAIVGATVASNVDCAPAKLVDLDPQFQFGSMIWGLQLVLGDGTNEYLRGDYAPAPFRDVIFGRISTAGGSSGASAKFTSVLENLKWGEAASASPALRALEEAAHAAGGRLSISLTTIGYDTNAASDNFSLGLLVGAIGAWHEGEPLFFPAGRRFAPTDAQPLGGSADFNLNFCDAWVGADRASIDLSNAIPLVDRNGTVTDQGPLALAVLRAPDTVTGAGAAAVLAAGTAQNAVVTAADYLLIGEIPYRDAGWLKASAGIASFALPDGARELARQRPLALIAKNSAGEEVVALRETIGGWFVRADGFEHRVDAGPAAQRLRIDLHARSYGAPLEGAAVPVTLDPRGSGGGGGRAEPHPPKAPIPDINFPATAIGLEGGGGYTTGADGKAEAGISVTDPGAPREYIDGQIYTFTYGFAAQGASAMHALDSLILHVRQAFAGPASPQWSDVGPIFTQFANLYPVMSRRMFDFSDETTAEAKAKILIFALTRALEDPNHMPVTRDLSGGKRTMLLAWLKQYWPSTAPPAPPLMKASLSLAVTQAVEAFEAAPVGAASRVGPLLPFQRIKGMAGEQLGDDALPHAPAPPPAGEE